VDTPIPLRVTFSALPCRGGEELLWNLFEPPGYAVSARRLPLDENFPDWEDIYATTAENTANRLVSIIDTGATSTAITLATAGLNQILRGVAFAPNTTANPNIFGTANNSNGFVITWTALLNENYTVQWTDDLPKKYWITPTNLTPNLPTMKLQIPALSQQPTVSTV
jgi:RNA repair, ligase-Pnkp-associating, region of Hen1